MASTIWDMAISELVVEEAGRGDPHAAALRLNALQGLPRLPASAEVRRLVGKILDAGALPLTEPEDALHIAIATVAGAHYLVTWSFAHLVGPDAKLKLLDTIPRLRLCPSPADNTRRTFGEH